MLHLGRKVGGYERVLLEVEHNTPHHHSSRVQGHHLMQVHERGPDVGGHGLDAQVHEAEQGGREQGAEQPFVQVDQQGAYVELYQHDYDVYYSSISDVRAREVINRDADAECIEVENWRGVRCGLM